MSSFIDPTKIERRELVPGITLRIMWGDKVMMSMVEIAPHAVLPAHTHPHEQAGLVLQGNFEFTIGGEKAGPGSRRRLHHPRGRGAQPDRIRRLGPGTRHIQPAERRVQVVANPSTDPAGSPDGYARGAAVDLDAVSGSRHPCTRPTSRRPRGRDPRWSRPPQSTPVTPGWESGG